MSTEAPMCSHLGQSEGSSLTADFSWTFCRERQSMPRGSSHSVLLTKRCGRNSSAVRTWPRGGYSRVMLSNLHTASVMNSAYATAHRFVHYLSLQPAYDSGSFRAIFGITRIPAI